MNFNSLITSLTRKALIDIYLKHCDDHDEGNGPKQNPSDLNATIFRFVSTRVIALIFIWAALYHSHVNRPRENRQPEKRREIKHLCQNTFKKG